MKTIKITVLAIISVALFTLASCKKTGETDPPSYGPSVALGNGEAKTFIRLDANGNPSEVGIAISEKAINSLPHEAELVLDFPTEKSKIPYKHVFLTYSHTGHEPPGIYDMGHFDAHFYTIPSDVRASIVNSDPRMAIFPTAGTLPKDYMPTAALPKMGQHWVDSTSVEFRGKPFTATFVYGSLDGKMVFDEPMISVDFLKKKTSEHYAIKTLSKQPLSGYFPQQYAVRYNAAAQQHEILLDNMILK